MTKCCAREESEVALRARMMQSGARINRNKSIGGYRWHNVEELTNREKIKLALTTAYIYWHGNSLNLFIGQVIQFTENKQIHFLHNNKLKGQDHPGT